METHSYSRTTPSLTTRAIIDRVKAYYEDERKKLAKDQELEITVPLSDGTLLSLRNIAYFAENLVLVQGEGNKGQEMEALVSPFGLQFIFRTVNITLDRPTSGIKFVDGKI